MANLVLVCRHHHRLVHEQGYAVTRSAKGALVFSRPDGVALQTNECRPRHDPPRASRPPDSLCALTGPARYDIGMAVVGLLTEDGFPADMTPAAYAAAQFDPAPA
jgi:hypothetical protein